MRKNKEDERKYQRDYNRANRVKATFDVRRDSKYPKIWDSIPYKKQFIVDCLEKYEALEKKRERDRAYKKNVREKRISRIGFDIEKGSKYEEIYKSIPNKAEWFRECLEKYEKEHKNE